MEHRLMSPPPAALGEAAEVTRNPSLVPQYQQCIESCLQCFETCEQMIVHCSSHTEVDPTLIRLLNDAVEISQVSATFMLRGSNFHIRTCAIAAEVCKVCAEACEVAATKQQDDLLRNCAEVLRATAKCCYKMAHHH